MDRMSAMHDEKPPDDFRSISVFPTAKDLQDDDPFVRANLTNSAYKRFAISLLPNAKPTFFAKKLSVYRLQSCSNCKL